MKKAKKLLAMLLSVILVMGCLSVSAATEALNVDAEDSSLLYSEDFTSETLDSRIVHTDGTYEPQNRRIYLKGGGSAIKMYFDENKLGYDKGTIEVEFGIIQYGAFDGDTQLQMALFNQADKNIHDFRFYGGGNRFVAFMNRNSSTTIGWQTEKLEKKTTYIFKVAYNPISKLTSFYVDGELVLEETANLDRFGADRGTDVAGISFTHSNTTGQFAINKIKFMAPKTAANADVWVDEINEEFNGSEVPAMVEQKSEYSYAVSNGALDVTCESSDPKERGTKFTFSESPLTGKYVVEVLLKATTMKSEAVRVWFGSGQANWYVQWDGNVLAGRYWDPNVVWYLTSDGGNYAMAADYNANSVLKITAHYDTTAGTVDVYFNDIFVTKMTFTGESKTTSTSINQITLAEKTGTLTIGSIRVYRPVEGLMVEEVEGGVKIASATEISAKLAAATYAGEGAATVLDSIAASDITLKPGVVYTVSTADYAGGNFYLWDSALKPLKAVLPIAAE